MTTPFIQQSRGPRLCLAFSVSTTLIEVCYVAELLRRRRMHCEAIELHLESLSWLALLDAGEPFYADPIQLPKLPVRVGCVH